VTDTLERGRREAELHDVVHRAQRSQGVGELAGGVAHDINDALSTILVCSELLGDDAVDEGERRQYSTQIEKAALRCAGFTSRLTEASQSDGALLRPVDVVQVLHDIRPTLTSTLGDDVHLRVARATEPCVVIVDPVRLEQLVLELAANARDAMPGGG